MIEDGRDLFRPGLVDRHCIELIHTTSLTVRADDRGAQREYSLALLPSLSLAYGCDPTSHVFGHEDRAQMGSRGYSR